MWYLQPDILIWILAAVAGMGALCAVAGRFGRQAAPLRFLALADLAVVAAADSRLAVFYALYTLAAFGLTVFLRRRRRGRRFWFVVCCVLCAAPFFYTRFTGFFPALPGAGLVLVGIAYNMLKAIDAVFYTYYTGEAIPFDLYANYLLFLPVFTAGPVFRYRDFKKTFRQPDPISLDGVTRGVKRGIRGLFKKLVVQTVAYTLLDRCLARGAVGFLPAVALSYAVVYLDMSGYADIAIGLGGILGLRVPENFKNPLTAPTWTQFWRNWHISFCDWIREHIFVLLNGRRLSRKQGAAVNFCTMFIMGLWHSFSPAGVADGVYSGLIMGGEALFGLTTVNKRKVKPAYYIFRCVLTNFLFALGTLTYTANPAYVPEALRFLLINS